MDKALSFVHLRRHSKPTEQHSLDRIGVKHLDSRNEQYRGAGIVTVVETDTNLVAHCREGITVSNHVNTIVLLQRTEQRIVVGVRRIAVAVPRIPFLRIDPENGSLGANPLHLQRKNRTI